MIEQIGGFIGMLAADVVHFFRGRQAVPCLVEWETEGEFMAYIDDAIQNDPTGVWDGECADCGDSCCLATDTIGEYEGKV